MDETLAANVRVIPVPVGKTLGQTSSFPRAWHRKGEPPRGDAVWCVPAGGCPRRRLLFLHGGAYAGNSPYDSQYLAFATQIARLTGLSVLSIDYRLAPEHRCPAPVTDSLAALKWMAAYGPPPRGAPRGTTAQRKSATQLFLCGDSAGGGLALACCLKAPLALRPLIRGIVAISPWTDMTASTSTYETRLWNTKTKTGDPFDDRESSLKMAATYIGKGPHRVRPTDIRASPFFASRARLRALPPTLFIVGDYELALGDSLELRDKMIAAGHLDASVSVYDRMFHCHVLYSEGKGLGQTLFAGVRGREELARWIADRSIRSRSRRHWYC